MSVYPLVICPDPRLSQASKPVNNVDDSIRTLMDNMLETMYASNGIGLAAVQIGENKRVLVMDIGYGSDRYESEDDTEPKNDPIFMADPKIIWSSEETNVYQEGCLSFPGQYADVTRPLQVKVEYLDYNNEKQILEADGLLSTCVQHEIDHLNGITFVDYLSRMKRQMIVKKIVKQQKLSET